MQYGSIRLFVCPPEASFGCVASAGPKEISTNLFLAAEE